MVIDLGVPLENRDHGVSRVESEREGRGRNFALFRRPVCDFRTLAFTLSKDGGLTMEKQIKKTSVWG
jgi:hypothetical protein